MQDQRSTTSLISLRPMSPSTHLPTSASRSSFFFRLRCSRLIGPLQTHSLARNRHLTSPASNFSILRRLGSFRRLSFIPDRRLRNPPSLMVRGAFSPPGCSLLDSPPLPGCPVVFLDPPSHCFDLAPPRYEDPYPPAHGARSIESLLTFPPFAGRYISCSLSA